MSVMLTNRPSPRPGFTHVSEARARRQGPVVVVASGSPGGVDALRRGAEEAALHSVHLYVLDTCAEGLKERLLTEPEDVEDRDRSVALSILRNPNVATSVLEAARIDQVVGFCQQVGASLLVLDRGCLVEASPLGPILDEADLACNVLIVRDRTGHTR